jgi:hypothetical protein
MIKSEWLAELAAVLRVARRRRGLGPSTCWPRSDRRCNSEGRS